MKKLLFVILSANILIHSYTTIRNYEQNYCVSPGDYSVITVGKPSDYILSCHRAPSYKNVDLDIYGRWYAYSEGYNAPTTYTPFMRGGIFDYQAAKEVQEIGAHTAPWEADNFAVNRKANLYMNY